ncbi:hypothetical protein [Dactylosporangium salmoneum]|uniref:Uncharacterized protein n=1 Tax=Dactylosporangium salmoneum TaxID=53361 RepID=A0ABN3GEM5_9ACTN
MAVQTFTEFMARCGRPVVDLDTTDQQCHTLLVTFAGGAKQPIVQVFGVAAGQDGEHLCIDVQAFVDDQVARSSVFGLDYGRRFEGFDAAAPGRSHGRPAVRGVSVLIGAQTDREPQS